MTDQTFLEKVAEQRDNLRCDICGCTEVLDLNILWMGACIRCDECIQQIKDGLLRKETGQDEDGNLCDRWRRWHPNPVPGELVPLPVRDDG